MFYYRIMNLAIIWGNASHGRKNNRTKIGIIGLMQKKR